METRKERARKMYDLASRGPSCSIGYGADLRNLTPKQRDAIEIEVRRSYRLWSTTWLLPELIALVPELAKRKPTGITSEPIKENT